MHTRLPRPPPPRAPKLRRPRALMVTAPESGVGDREPGLWGGGSIGKYQHEPPGWSRYAGYARVVLHW